MNTPPSSTVFEVTITVMVAGKEEERVFRSHSNSDIDFEIERLELTEGVEVIGVDVKMVEQIPPKPNGGSSHLN